jgi:hypothetical protein
MDARHAPVRRVLSNFVRFRWQQLQPAVRAAAMTPVFVETVGLAAPGFPSWQEGRATLRGETAFSAAPLSAHTPAMLPLNERRRASPVVRLAFRAAEDALSGTALSAAGLATVFASSYTDLAILASHLPRAGPRRRGSSHRPISTTP